MRTNGKPKTFIIGGRKYRLQKLVMGQVIELAEYLASIDIDFQNIKSFKEFVLKYIQYMPRLLAIVLVPEDTPLHERDLDKEEHFLYCNVELDTMVEVVEHFFTLHDITSLMNKLTALIEKVTEQVSQTSERR